MRVDFVYKELFRFQSSPPRGGKGAMLPMQQISILLGRLGARQAIQMFIQSLR